MALGGVIATFVMTIIFGIIAPTFDVGSDVKLLVDVVTFQVGDSLELSGCRMCYGLSTDEVYNPKVEHFKTCISSPVGIDLNPSVKCDFSAASMDQLRVIKGDSTPRKKVWVVRNEELVSEDECNSTEKCCIHKTNTSRTSSQWTHIDGRIQTPFCTPLWNVTAEHSCLLCFHVAKESLFYCNLMLLTLGQKYNSQWKNMRNIAKLNNCDSLYYTMNRNFSKQDVNQNILFKETFTHDDQFGLSFRTHDINSINENMVCDQSVCLTHLNSVSKFYSSPDFNYESWKHLMIYDRLNRRIGGKLCTVLTIYGWSILIPIFLNLTFHICMFYRDLKNRKVSHVEFISVLILCYPQWRCIKFLVNYLYHKDENRLQNEKETYQREVETIEAFAEAGIQV